MSIFITHIHAELQPVYHTPSISPKTFWCVTGVLTALTGAALLLSGYNWYKQKATQEKMNNNLSCAHKSLFEVKKTLKKQITIYNENCLTINRNHNLLENRLNEHSVRLTMLELMFALGIQEMSSRNKSFKKENFSVQKWVKKSDV